MGIEADVVIDYITNQEGKENANSNTFNTINESTSVNVTTNESRKDKLQMETLLKFPMLLLQSLMTTVQEKT